MRVSELLDFRPLRPDLAEKYDIDTASEMSLRNIIRLFYIAGLSGLGLDDASKEAAINDCVDFYIKSLEEKFDSN